ncbi:MAG TPA: Arm DNA-binding domain-containing protein [Vineibacter sp.]|nr:Arm DNA-binding domain-containing protein [Vineibacter sp.]
MPRHLATRLVESAKPAAADMLIYDTEVIGFGIRIGRGSARAHIVEYRLPTGQRRRKTIGRRGSPWTVEQARKEAIRLLGQVVAGVDPMDARKARRSGMTVAQLCELYLREGCDRKKSPIIANDRGRMDRHIRPLLGNKQVSAPGSDDIETFLGDVAAGMTAVDVRTKLRGRESARRPRHRDANSGPLARYSIVCR